MWTVVPICAALLISACGGSQRSNNPEDYAGEAGQAFAEAEDALDSNNFTYALGLYRRVREDYELSPYAVLAELRVGDVYFEQGAYRQAADTYRQFLQLHPDHGAVPYARFRIGMSYFEDMPSSFFILPAPYERELGSTRSAAQTLGDFIQRYESADDEETQGYVATAREAYQEALDRLAGFEFYVGTFYLQNGRPIAAAHHFALLLDDYPDSSMAPDSLFLLGRCYIELADVLSALESFRALQLHFPEHRLTQRAMTWMDQHGISFDELEVEL